METPDQASIHSGMLIVSMAFGESSSMHKTQDEVYIVCDSEASHVIVAVWCSCRQLSSNSALVSQGSYLQRHTSSLILKMSQDAATPPLPAVAHMVSLTPLLSYPNNVL